MAGIPAFQDTSIESIEPLVTGLTKTFTSQKTKPTDFRIRQLRKLYWSIVDHEAALLEALDRDLGKPKFESVLTEIEWVKNDCLFLIDNLTKWSKDESIPDMPLSMYLMGFRIKKEPLGTILVIGAYNYPVQLTLGPFMGAISAGCTGVMKPSEQSPNTAMVLGQICSVLDPSCYAVVQGGIPETTKLLDMSIWDKIFYTGSPNVGKIIAQKAAKHLIPTTLELGGRNPAIITKNADLKIAAKRIVWGKAQNVGQICLSSNYTLVERSAMPQFVEALKAAANQFFPNGTQTSPDYGKIATERGWQRLHQLLGETRGKIVYGGKTDKESRFIELTIVEVPDASDPLVVDEHFGPIIVLLPVDSVDDAIRIAQEVDPTPLTAYAFGNKAETDKILDHVRSGGATVNDTLFHASQRTPPFGGIKTSGTGAYRGRSSFETFTHRRTVANIPLWAESLLKGRYPPYSDKALKQIMSLGGGGTPKFDRQGNPSYSLWDYILSPRLFTLITLVAVAIGTKQYQNRQAKL